MTFAPHFNRRSLLIASASALSPVWAQSPIFPSKLLKIVPFGTAGGPIDIIARLYGDKLQQRWGKPVIVEVKPGASGILAANEVARSEPDGHTVLFTLPLTHINNAILLKKLPYDPLRDFQPISQIAVGGPMLVVRADAPYSTLGEFVAYAKKKPGLTYGTWGQGSEAHLLCELLSRKEDLKFVHVPYKSQSAAHGDMFAGVLDFAWANPATARAMAQAGKMKALGITGTRRVSTMPDVPTFSEAGYTGFDLDSWVGVYGPANIAPGILNTWVKALKEITSMPDVNARLTDLGFKGLANTPSEFLDSYKKDFPRIKELISAAGVTAE